MRKALLLLLGVFLSFNAVQAQSIVINKLLNGSNDADGRTDAVELLVVQDHLDIRGFIIKDFENNITTEGGRFEFKDEPLWRDLRKGTTIILRNLSGLQGNYVQDTDPSDFIIDVLLQNTTYFTNRGGTAIFNLTGNDMVMIKTGEPTGTAGSIHAFAYGSAANIDASAHFASTTSPKIKLVYANPGGGYFYYPTNPTQNVSDYNGTSATASNAITNANDAQRQWGFGYGAGNRNFIASLRRPVVAEGPVNLPVVVNKIYNATDTNDGKSDAFELLVVQDHFDMRNLVVKDFNDNLVNDTGGKYRFKNIAFWADMRKGTTIVLRKTQSQDAAYVEDTDASDFTLDLLLTNSSPYLDNVALSGHEFNLTMTDMVMIKRGDINGAGDAIHALVSNNGNASTAGSFFNAIYSRALVSAETNGTGFFLYPLNPTVSIEDFDGVKAKSSTDTDRKWGMGYGDNNRAFIASLRAPAAPSDLTAAAITATQIDLSWSDNSPNETGFEIERSTDGTTFNSLATVGANVTTYSDKTVVGSTKYYYRVRATGASAASEFSNVAEIITNIAKVLTVSFTPQTVYENAPLGTVAGELTSTSDNASATFTYSLVSGDGDTDNAAFSISGNQLQTAAALNFEAKSSYSVRVRSTSSSGHFLEEVFTVAVQDVNEAPTLAAIADQVACNITQTQTIALSNATPGPETTQTLTYSVASTNSALFEELSITPGANGAAQLSYRLKAGALGEADVTVTLKDNGGTAHGGTDTFTRTFKLTSVALPTATITSNQGTQLSKGLTATLTASGGTSYVWANANGIVSGQNSATLTVRPEATTTYQVTVTNENGCTDTESITLEVTENYSVLQAFNLLTPNNDGVNDKWVIQNIDFYRNNEVKVFDRAGRVVFQQKGYRNTWDGTYQNAPLAAGTYYYIVDFGNGQPLFKGFITVVRD
ncbi:gliding motility-associated C-terminal domain-containing protein [Rufibacter quisquiliarum]|uniref:Gliding motility-associated-like protein n=1 Tax=Rufibacter quisquiliarum TaxID=1549639 RepID=A0A839GQK9_9BACT|nr:gliding motility-associated C-terminal domain-containing protein [Rufibacter quisquiliarum]MBA9076121.1 gliding motility-associated-like protein [Rufibacter quisquiliarum]